MNTQKKHWINLIGLLMVICGSNLSFGEPFTVVLKDLIQDADQASWSNNTGNSISLGANEGLEGNVKITQIPVVLSDPRTQNGDLLVEDAIQTDVIEIQFPLTIFQKDRVVRGSYLVNLPEMKRIQLEAAFDLLIDNEGQRNPTQFSVEVYERNLLDQNYWVKTGEFSLAEDAVPPDSARLYRIRNTQFSNHVIVANLSSYRGREIRLDLVAALPAPFLTQQNARWTELRLIGSRIDYQLGPSESRANSIRPAKVAVQPTPKRVMPLITPTPTYYIGAAATVTINSVTNYPDTGFSTVKTYGESGGSNPERWFGYFNGLMEPTGSKTVTNVNKRGTMALDLKNYYTSDFFYISTNTLHSCLLRGTSLAASAPAEDGTPFRVIIPHDKQWNKWDNWYTGVHSCIKATTGAYTRVHAFSHVEDLSKNEINQNAGDRRYDRIGYSRSANNHGYNFDLGSGIYLMSDSNVGSPTPAIESWVKESDTTMVSKVSNGVGAPSVIQSGTYLYMFYSRWIYYQDVASWPIGTTPPWDTICAARAEMDKVINEGYSSLPNPWKNYRNGNWDENGRNGYSTPVITDAVGENRYRTFCKVVNDSYFNAFIMICKGTNGFYLYFNDDLSQSNWGTGLLIGGMEGGGYIHYPSLVGETGDDKAGRVNYMLYYALDTDTQEQGTFMARRIIYIYY